ncbi:transposase [Streptomyces tauricus]|uniref:Transposase n=2 Tax=Streptomyces tauricus TaxID=68274 RepID=A0ABZ1JC26_9ACTN
MTSRRPCPSAPGPLEEYAARFDDVFATLAQRRGFRECLVGLLGPRDRNKTITCLAGAEPVDGAGGSAVQRLQFFLSGSTWNAETVNDRRLHLLRTHEATAPHGAGVIVIDDSGDRKAGTETAHVGRQWLGRLGKTDNGIVTVTTVWTDGRIYYPLHAQPYTPAHHFDRGRADPAFRTEPQISAALAVRGKEAGFACRAVVADCAYSTSDDWYFALCDADLPYVVALGPHCGTWARTDEPHTPLDAAHALDGTDPEHPGDWTPVERHFRDGHTETWWAADARLGGYGPHSPCRLIVATTDPGTLPEKATWYLTTSLPPPGCRARRHQRPSAGRPRRDRPPLRAAAVDRAGLQTDQGRTRLGRLSGPLRCRDPAPPDSGELRVHLLLGPVVRPTRPTGRHRAGSLPRRPAREGEPSHTTSPKCPAGPGHCVPCGPGSLRPPPCTAGGVPGPTRTHHPNSRPSSMRLPRADPLISTAGFNELPVSTSGCCWRG